MTTLCAPHSPLNYLGGLLITSLLAGLVRSASEHEAIKCRNSLKHARCESILARDLMREYDSGTKPIDEVIHVELRLIPMKVLGLVEKDEMMESIVRLQIHWVDPGLTWEPAKYGDLKEIFVPVDQIWNPDISLMNSINDVYVLTRDYRFQGKVTHKGDVWWHPTGVVRTRCKMDLHYFPFDFQRCYFDLESSSHDIQYMNITTRVGKKAIDDRMYSENDQWDYNALLSDGVNIIHQVSSSTSFTLVRFYMVISRKPDFYTLNILFPCIVLSVMQVLSFLVPPTHPQRVGQSTTVMLAVIVFQTVVVEELPRTSSTTPLLSVYLGLLEFISVLSVAEAVLSAHLIGRSEFGAVPNWLYILVHWKRRPARNLMAPLPEMPGGSNHETTAMLANGGTPGFNPTNLVGKFGDAWICGAPDNIKEWREVARVLNKISFVISSSLAFICPFVLFIWLPMYADTNVRNKDVYRIL